MPRQKKGSVQWLYAFTSLQWRPALDPPRPSGSFVEEEEAVLGHPSCPRQPSAAQSRASGAARCATGADPFIFLPTTTSQWVSCTRLQARG